VTWGEEGSETRRDETAEGTQNGDGCAAWSQDGKGVVTRKRLWAVARRRRYGKCVREHRARVWGVRDGQKLGAARERSRARGGPSARGERS
jgi:hypothetical protein